MIQAQTALNMEPDVSYTPPVSAGYTYAQNNQGIDQYYQNIQNWFANNPGSFVEGHVQQGIALEAGDTGDYFSIEWIGYFRPLVSGLYKFYTYSDDGSYLWIGNDALSGFTTNNATVNNGGLHGGQLAGGNVQVNLTAGQYYPIRVQYYELQGGQAMQAEWELNNGGAITDWSGQIFYNPTTNGF
mgnify:CR=1 FL=1